jgi:hypothetical protein
LIYLNIFIKKEEEYAGMEELNSYLDIAVAATDTPPCMADYMESEEAWRLTDNFGIWDALKILTPGRPTHAVYIC